MSEYVLKEECFDYVDQVEMLEFFYINKFLQRLPK